MEMCAIQGNVSEWSVTFDECKKCSVWGVCRCTCDVSVDRKSFLFVIILLFWFK